MRKKTILKPAKNLVVGDEVLFDDGGFLKISKIERGFVRLKFRDCIKQAIYIEFEPSNGWVQLHPDELITTRYVSEVINCNEIPRSL